LKEKLCEGWITGQSYNNLIRTGCKHASVWQQRAKETVSLAEAKQIQKGKCCCDLWRQRIIPTWTAAWNFTVTWFHIKIALGQKKKSNHAKTTQHMNNSLTGL